MDILRPAKFRSIYYFLALSGLALLPLLPELYLCLRNHAGLKSFGPIAYYEAIVSFLLLAPALLLNRFWARLWVIVIGFGMGVATILVAWQSLSVGARWDITAHSALMQTSLHEVWGYLHAFASWKAVGLILALIAGFLFMIVINVRAAIPPRRISLIVLLSGFLACGHGLYNAVRYGGRQVHPVSIESGASLMIADIGINKFHPVTLMLVTHYNYRVTHDYYLQAYRKIAGYAQIFQGSKPIASASAPRLIVVVVGESASRRHWSLYGYDRETTPELKALGSDVLLFSDVISASVGTQPVLRGMFTTHVNSLPVFPLFSAAGYRTHWFSAQYSQGENDVEVAALIQSCDERIFLNGSYDENLLPFVEKASNEPGRHIIFLNLFGSHVRYEDRYPDSFSVFHGVTEKERLLATYDNSIRYTDHVLARLIALLRQRDEASCLLYVSDHAEDVYDSTPDAYLFRSDALATNAMYEVPFVVWFSSEYRKGNPGFVEEVTKARDRKYQTLPLYDSLIDLARFTHPMYDPHHSLFSPDFIEKERHVGVKGRVYTK